MVIAAAQPGSTNPKFKFGAGLNPVCSVSEVCDGRSLCQWFLMEIRLNAFYWSAIPHKQFIIIIVIPTIQIFYKAKKEYHYPFGEYRIKTALCCLFEWLESRYIFIARSFSPIDISSLEKVQN